jgi:hypothetical protein
MKSKDCHFCAMALQVIYSTVVDMFGFIAPRVRCGRRGFYLSVVITTCHRDGWRRGGQHPVDHRHKRGPDWLGQEEQNCFGPGPGLSFEDILFAFVRQFS